MTSALLSHNSNLNPQSKLLSRVRGWCALRSAKMKYALITSLIITLISKFHAEANEPQEKQAIDIKGLVPHHIDSDRDQVLSNIKRIDSHKHKLRVKVKSLEFYCGPPDAISPPDENGVILWAYFYDRVDTNNQWVAYAVIDNGIVTGFGYNQADVNDHSKFEILNPEVIPLQIAPAEQDAAPNH